MGYHGGLLESLCADPTLDKFRNWRMVIGSSIGALSAGLIAQYPPEKQCSEAVPELVAFWNSIQDDMDVFKSAQIDNPVQASRKKCMSLKDTPSMILSFWNKGGFCSMEPGEEAFHFEVTRQNINNSGMMLRVVATSLNNGTGKWWSEQDM